MPHASEFAFLDWPGPIAFAHRGGASEAPENTMPAFEYAVGLGYRYLETDVHVTSDGVLLAFHDDVLDRVTDRTGTIAELPYDEVRHALVDGREPIPLFDDLLAAWPDVRINVDPKHDESVEPLAEVVKRAGATDRICVGAFSDARLEHIRALLPGVCTSLGPLAIAQFVGSLDGQADPPDLPSPCAQVPTHVGDTELVTAAFVDALHSRGLQVHIWTIDARDEMVRLLDLGVDGIMTDRPTDLKDLLVERGAWI